MREVALDAQDAAERLAELRAKDARAAAADAAVHAFNTHMNYTQVRAVSWVAGGVGWTWFSLLLFANGSL